MSRGQRTGLIAVIVVLMAGGLAALFTRGAGGCTRDVPLDVRAAIGSKVKSFGPGQSISPGLYIGYNDGTRWFVRAVLDVSVSGAGIGSFSKQDFVVRGGKGHRAVTSIKPAPAFDVPAEQDLKVAEKGFTKLQTCH